VARTAGIVVLLKRMPGLLMFILKENNMKLYRTPAEYREIVRNMPIQEVDGLFETFQNCQTRTAQETQIMDILEAEIERRIAGWEVAYV
jgi:hypothetical protein